MRLPIPKLIPESKEFILLMAVTMAAVAISIDAMLPAMPTIAADFAITNPNHQQLIISLLFAGLAIGQLFVGPLSDTIGRKPTIYIGLGLFIIGCLLCLFSTSFHGLLIGRVIQGMGAAAPRIMSIAIVRDCFHGREMARISSYVMGIFIMVPTFAPTIGQWVMMASNWHMIIVLFLLHACVVLAWIALRLPETLHPEYKRDFRLSILWEGAKIVLTNKQCVCYLIIAGLVFGAFVGFLNSSAQIFTDYYDVGDHFPYYFGVMAASLGVAFFTNASLVETFGIRKTVRYALIAMLTLALGFLALFVLRSDMVPLPAFMAFIMSTSFCLGMLFGNTNALAMEPMGHVAGIASALIGCLSLIISASIGGAIGQLFNDTLLPITLGFAGLAISALFIMFIAEYRRTDNHQ